MLLNRYSDIDYLMNLDFEYGREIIVKAIEKQKEDKIWQLWVEIYPHMDKDNFKPFNEFLDMFKPNNVNTSVVQTKEELIAEIEKVKAIHQQK